MTIELEIDGDYETVDVQDIGNGRFILLNTPILCNREDDFIYLGDIIETEVMTDGTHRLLRVAERSSLRHHSWLVPRWFVESKEYPAFFEAIDDADGAVEGVMGGLLFVHVPAESELDPVAELERRMAAAKGAGPDARPRDRLMKAKIARAVMRTSARGEPRR